MSIRSIVLGLLAAVFIAGFGYLNDSVMRLTYLVGNHFPIFVFGLLILLTIAVNPLLGLFGNRAKLRPSELAVIVAMMLVTCSIPGSGLMRTFTNVLALPIHFNQVQAGWKKNQVLELTPDALLPADGEYRKEMISEFLTGHFRGADLPLTDPRVVPWEYWKKPLLSWMPLIVLMNVGVLCLALVVHRQWSAWERLRYPVADFATALTSQAGNGSLLRNRLFWFGLGTIFTIHLINGLHVWYPDHMVQIPLQVDMSQIAQKWPQFGRAPYCWNLLRPIFYPTVVAFAFFLASDVSFSLGVTQLLFVPLMAGLIVAGVNTRTDWMTGGTISSQLAGSYLGLGLILLYVGRRYYANALKAALTFRRQEGVESYAAWALRVFLLCAAGMVLWLVFRTSLPWPFAVLVVLSLFLMFLVMSRLIAETGLIYMQPSWQPLAVLIGLFGWEALGPQVVIVAGLICAVLTIDPREALMPFVANALKLGENTQVRPGRLGWVMAVVFLVGLAVAVPVVLGSNYARGYPLMDYWANNMVPRFTYNAVSNQMDQLRNAGLLEQSMNYTTWERVRAAWPLQAEQKSFLAWGGLGLLLVLVASYLRLRFTWWPIHPVLFLAWGTAPLARFSHSFLLGWLIKTFVTGLGGGKKYRQLQPLMIGVIGGDLLGGLLWMAVGAAYYGVTGNIPTANYMIFPG
ncbi:MAG TPA: hypothetical protein DCX07_04310 [Phycisphaerales bacterium]|nr:hypothetical protein [Phycisphaerales bacterium]